MADWKILQQKYGLLLSVVFLIVIIAIVAVSPSGYLTGGGKSTQSTPYQLKVIKSVAVGGTIDISGHDKPFCGINCPNTFTTHDSGSTVTITITPAGEYGITSWTGVCAPSGVSRTCTFPMPASNTAVTVNLAPPVKVTLAVSKSINESGTIDVSSGGHSFSPCDTTCTTSYTTHDTGITATITITPASGYKITGWTGDCAYARTATTCRIRMDSVKSVTVNLAPPLSTVTVTHSPDKPKVGEIVTFTANATAPAGKTISYMEIFFGTKQSKYCAIRASSGTCVHNRTFGLADTYDYFAGATDSSGQFATSGLKKVTVTAFEALKVTKLGDGTVTITSSPAGINCGTTCSSQNYDFPSGTVVTLTETPTADTTFRRWIGVTCPEGTQTGTTCTVTMNTRKDVTANFKLTVAPTTYKLTATVSGAGSVSVSPMGKNCGTMCWLYNPGDAVTITAFGSSGMTFRGWAGCTQIAGDPQRCRVTMNADNKQVTATFSSEIDTPFPINAWHETVGVGEWLPCTTADMEGGSAWVDKYCKAQGYAGMPSGNACFHTNVLERWGLAGTPEAPLQGISGHGGDAVTKVGCDRGYGLTVTKSGAGTVTSQPAGISCGAGAGCTRNYVANTLVTLTATAGSNSVLDGWTGCTPSTLSVGQCTVTMDGPKTVTARFTPMTGGGIGGLGGTLK